MQTTDEVGWNVHVAPDPVDGFGWHLWTDHSMWVPLSVRGRANSEQEANAVARKVAARCTDAAHFYIQRAGSGDVRFALLNVFPGTPAGGGSALMCMSLTGDEHDDEQERWSDLEARAVDWQTRGGRQRFVAMDAGEDESGWRLRELFGCMGALGEQATLACAAARDLAVWAGAPESPRAELVRRGWAEHVMHWTMAAGHMFQNVAGRAVALDPAVRPHLLEQQAATSERSRTRALGTVFPHESDAKRDWPTFNKSHANYVRRAAAESTVPGVGGLASWFTDSPSTPNGSR